MSLPRIAVLFSFVSLSGILSTPLTAQQTNGTLAGVVRDTTGAVLPGATVTITNEKTRSTRVITSAPDGTYSAAVPPGLYTVAAEVPGFATATERGARRATRSGDSASGPCVTITSRVPCGKPSSPGRARRRSTTASR